MALYKPISLEQAVRDGKLNRYLSRYLADCHPPAASASGTDGKSDSRTDSKSDSRSDSRRSGGRFPNLAGFCRWLGCGISEVDALSLSHPEAADYLRTVMEDEALNSPLLSATLTGAYLKRRLGYADKSNAVSQAECGDVQVIFEHDISEDGS